MTEETIFARAIEKPDQAERSAFLDEACGDDADLRLRVETLLKAHDDSGFLQHPIESTLGATVDQGPADPTVDLPSQKTTEGLGTMIGPYKLLQQIGEGGMGTVFMAEQEKPVRRKVALKIIKHGMDTAQVVARFEAERQALALMDHQNIARVLDAGATETGRPFLVMELVKGVPITEYCDRNHLTPRERLELLVPVCQAIQHAHQKGIIHRDIKPSNVMINLLGPEEDGAGAADALVRGELDWIVMKAMERHLTRRHEMANGFARDIQRFLDGDAIEACPPSRTYRLKQLLAKHRVAIATASAFAGVLIAAAGVSAAMALNAKRAEATTARERDRALAAENSANEQKARAQDREKMAIDAVKRFRDAISDEPALKNTPSLDGLRKRLRWPSSAPCATASPGPSSSRWP